MENRHMFMAILLLAACASTVAAEVATLRADSVEAAPDSVAAVAIDVSGVKAFRAMHVEVRYDPAVLAVDKVDAGPALSGALLVPHPEWNGVVGLSIAAAEGVPGQGTLATIHFRVLGASGKESALVFEDCKVWAPGDDAALIPVETVSGSIRVVKPLPWLLIGLGGLALVGLLSLVAVLRRKPAVVRSKPVGAGVSPPAKAGPSASRTCPHCDAAAGPSLKFCGECGKSLVPVCGKCGAAFEGKVRFCGQCGAPRA